MTEKRLSAEPKTHEIIHVRRLAREYTEAAIETLAEIMTDEEVAPAVRIQAAQAILDRGYGKPVAPLSVDTRVTLESVLLRLGPASIEGPAERPLLMIEGGLADEADDGGDGSQ